jgi:hypothetical protein
MNWAVSLMENHDPYLRNYEAFVVRMKSIYGDYDSTLFIPNQKLKIIKKTYLGDIKNYNFGVASINYPKVILQ